MSPDTILTIKQRVFAQVEKIRNEIATGKADLKPIEGLVQEYCTAISALPVAEARAHSADLNTLNEMMNTLESELLKLRNQAEDRLTRLDQLVKANIAYRKPEVIGEVELIAEAEEEAK